MISWPDLADNVISKKIRAKDNLEIEYDFRVGCELEEIIINSHRIEPRLRIKSTT